MNYHYPKCKSLKVNFVNLNIKYTYLFVYLNSILFHRMQFKALTLALMSMMLSPALSQGLVVVTGSTGMVTDSSTTLNALPDTTSTLAINQNTVSTSTSQINEARNTGSLVSRGQLKGKAKGLQRIPTKS